MLRFNINKGRFNVFLNFDIFHDEKVNARVFKIILHSQLKTKSRLSVFFRRYRQNDKINKILKLIKN
eukprot:UN18546